MSSGFRADSVHGKTWGRKGQTPVVERPGQRQSISAASAVNARGGFWYCTYQGGLNAEAFVSLLRRMMRRRSKPVHLVLDGLPAHRTTLVKTYVASTKGMLTLHFLPGYAPELNPDELVWSHMKRTGVARAPLRRGEKLQAKIEAATQRHQAHASVDTVILQGTKCLLYYRLVSNGETTMTTTLTYKDGQDGLIANKMGFPPLRDNRPSWHRIYAHCDIWCESS